MMPPRYAQSHSHPPSSHGHDLVQGEGPLRSLQLRACAVRMSALCALTRPQKRAANKEVPKPSDASLRLLLWAPSLRCGFRRRA